MANKRQKERQIVLWFIGVLAMNYPILTLFSKVKLVLNIPMLYLYIFTCWAIFVICVALVMELPASPQDSFKTPEIKNLN
jgi:hypothetical protein